MAEAEMDTDSSSESDPDRISLQILVSPDSRQKQFNVLMLTPQWQFDGYGVATVTRALVQNLRAIDPEGDFIKITCIILQEEGNIPRVRSAEELKVKLKGYKQPRGKRRKPAIEWMDDHIKTYYEYVLVDIKYDFIIGHIPHIANGCLNLRDACMQRRHCLKVLFIAHDVPRLENGETNDEQLREWVLDADVIFSVTKSVEQKIKQMDTSGHVVHKFYIPGHPVEFFKTNRDETEKLRDPREILMITKEKKSLEVNGLDLQLAVNSLAEASQRTHASISLTMRTEKIDDMKEWDKVQKKSSCNFPM